MGTLAERFNAKAPAAAGRLPADRLYRRCDPATLAFQTTDDVGETPITLGQERAVSAIQFGIGIRDHGYNLFALGASTPAEREIVCRFLEQQAASEPTPADWCYVHNFQQPDHPRTIALPAGRGAKFRDDMTRLVEDLRTAVAAALETEEYRLRHQQIDQEFNDRRQAAVADLAKRASDRNVAVVQTPMGFALAPMRDGRPLESEAFEKLPAEERGAIRAALDAFDAELEDLLHLVPKWRRESRERERALRRAVIGRAVDALVDELSSAYEGQPSVQAYLSLVKTDVTEHADDFRTTKDNDDGGALEALIARSVAALHPLGRYEVNVLDGVGPTGARVVYEDKPTLQNLVGRIEHVAHMGTLVTHFTLIKPGALHRANGGYLVVDARRLLFEPFAWEGLKRALRTRELRIESPGEAFGLASTVSLVPDPIPLNVKVVLVGDRALYYLLYEHDPEFRDLFKVAVDFETSMDRGAASERAYGRVLATLVRRAGLRPFSASAVARIVEHGARVVGDAHKLWLDIERLTDLLQESAYWAGAAGRGVVDAPDVQQAIDSSMYRSGRPRERIQEEIARGTIVIGTTGEAVGQVNGLSVIDLGGFTFGRPSRITARVRFGAGTVVDIEREVELGGPIHSKGVLILSGFLAGRYVPDQPLSLSASIVFEQSYGAVEGDSASSAELYALLSALAGVPIRQNIAVTGSVNQRGEVQAVGGINEKIEGFFDVCRAGGLTGDQGVLIPVANIRHLMLRRDVLDAVTAGTFHVYAAATVDEGMETLTGKSPGVRDLSGRFPSNTINASIEERLLAFAERARLLRSGPESGPGRI